MMMKKKMIALLAAMGVMMAPVLSTEAAWNVDGTGWWYTHEDGGYAVNQWEQVQGTWYHFDGSGYMQTGWQWIDGSWYYLDGSGAMLTGWQWINGAWYYMNGSGAMQTGWQVIDESWYYLHGNGAMAADQWIGNYYVDGSGRMAANTWIGNYYVGADGCWIPEYGSAQWIQDSNGWWYRHGDGGYTRNGWEMISGSWYYFNGAGYMVTGWQNLGGSWYYFYESGAMASDTRINGDYVDENGVWIPEPTIHVHDWEAVYRTVHHDAWDEVVEKEVYDPWECCNVCGADITANYYEHEKQHALAGEGGGRHTEYYKTVKTTVHHDAWNEQVLDGYVCTSCGATKEK